MATVDPIVHWVGQEVGKAVSTLVAEQLSLEECDASGGPPPNPPHGPDPIAGVGRHLAGPTAGTAIEPQWELPSCCFEDSNGKALYTLFNP